MSHHQPSLKKKPGRNKTSQPKAKPTAAPPTGLVAPPKEPVNLSSLASTEVHTAQLRRSAGQPHQGQRLALEIGRTHGNRHLQRVVAALNEPGPLAAVKPIPQPRQPTAAVVNRGDRPKTAVQREDDKKESNIQKLDKMLDRWNVPEGEVISLLGKLDQPEKNTVLAPKNGYKAKLASALNTEEMVQAVRNVTIGPYNPLLHVKLEWILAAAGSASSIDYHHIKEFITSAPSEQKLALRGWRNFFVDVCTNKTMFEAVNDLGFDMPAKLNWIWAEMTLVRAELAYSDIKSLITTASETDRNALQTDTWKDFFVKVCTNATMLEALTDLGWKEIKPRIEWMIEEGTDYKPHLLDLIRKAEETPRKNLKASGPLMGRFHSDFGSAGFWQIQLLLKYGPEANFPAPVKTILEAIQGAVDVTKLRRIIANMSADDCQKVETEYGAKGALQGVLSQADYKFVWRMLTEGLLAEDTGQGTKLSETLQVGDPATEAFAGKKFDWTSGYDVAYYRDRLEVTVRIDLKPVNNTAKTQLATAQPIWKTNIETAWNKFKIDNGLHLLPIKFICDFTSSKPHHEVNVHPGSPTKWPGVDMGNWYTGKLTSPNHEFGHMLGNKDEYFLTKDHFMETTGIDPTTMPAADVKAETDTAGNTRYTAQTSIMGISSQPVQPRHLNHFVNWVNDNRRKKVDGAFAEPRFRLIT